jgi:gamma-glutamylcyclotransferase (GGCT)/AIG2-like uncharacterized protein YtfP
MELVGGSMTEMKFFVYGSMSEGLVHFNKIKDFINYSIPAATQASAYRLKVGYPVLMQDGQDLVQGELLGLRMTEFLINLLDEFHGFYKLDESKSLYFRREITIKTMHGEEQAWAYVLNPKKLPKTATLILGGDWKSSLVAEPPLTEKLTDRQRSYIQRLGNSTGREIVPIDLPLYRELMNLEMIVDKGRRLALSKTGHEVFRYLN